MPGSSPHAQDSVALGQGIGEHEGALVRQPERGLGATASVVEGDKAAGQLRARIDRLELRLRDVVSPEERRPVGLDAVAPDEEVDIPDVVGLQYNGHGRRRRVESLPDLARVRRWSDRVEYGHLAPGLDDGRGDRRFPAG